MALVMLVAMRSMFPSRRHNHLLAAGAIIVFGVPSTACAPRPRSATSSSQVDDPAPLRGDPECQEASITNPEIEALCHEIVVAQHREIEQMEALLEQY